MSWNLIQPRQFHTDRSALLACGRGRLLAQVPGAMLAVATLGPQRSEGQAAVPPAMLARIDLNGWTRHGAVTQPGTRHARAACQGRSRFFDTSGPGKPGTRHASGDHENQEQSQRSQELACGTLV